MTNVRQMRRSVCRARALRDDLLDGGRAGNASSFADWTTSYRLCAITGPDGRAVHVHALPEWWPGRSWRTFGLRSHVWTKDSDPTALRAWLAS